MTKAIGMAVFVAILGVGGTLYAQDGVDCSNVPKRDSDAHYKKGDLVKENYGDGTFEFRCNTNDCWRSPVSKNSNWPWELVGKCR